MHKSLLIPGSCHWMSCLSVNLITEELWGPSWWISGILHIGWAEAIVILLYNTQTHVHSKLDGKYFEQEDCSVRRHAERRWTLLWTCGLSQTLISTQPSGSLVYWCVLQMPSGTLSTTHIYSWNTNCTFSEHCLVLRVFRVRAGRFRVWTPTSVL